MTPDVTSPDSGYTARLEDEVRGWEEWSNRLAENIPDHYDGDDSQEAIIEKYVADLEAKVRRLEMSRADTYRAWEGSEKECAKLRAEVERTTIAAEAAIEHANQRRMTAEAAVARVAALAERLDARFLHEDADAIRRALAEDISGGGGAPTRWVRGVNEYVEVPDDLPCPNCGGDRLRPNFTGDNGMCCVGGTPYGVPLGSCACGHAEDAHIGDTGLCSQPYEDGSGVGGCNCRTFTPATPRREALADAIYRLNGQALYGRDLGEFDSPRMEAERWRWLEQADLVLAALSDPTTPDQKGGE